MADAAQWVDFAAKPVTWAGFALVVLFGVFRLANRVWTSADRYAGEFIHAQKGQAEAMTLLAANVKQTFDDQRESLIVMRVISNQNDELKAQNEVHNRQLAELTQVVKGLHGNAN